MVSIPRLSAWLVAILVLLVAVGFVYPVERQIPVLLVAALAIAGIVLAPWRLGLLSWSAGIPAYYGLFFVAIPLLNRCIGKDDSADDREISEALYIAAFGIATFVLGTNVMRVVPQPRQYDMLGLLRLDSTLKPSALMVLLIVGATAMLWSYFFGYFGLVQTEDAAGGAGAVGTLGFLLTVALTISWTSYFKRGRFLFIALASTALLLLTGIAANSKSMMLTPLLLIGLSYWGVSGRFPYKLAIAGAVFYALVVFPFVTAGRVASLVSQYGGSREDFAGKVYEYLLSSEWQDLSSDYTAIDAFGRGLLGYFAEIVEHTGRSVSFMSGRTIYEGIEQFVPRFLYPDKPDMSIGNWTGQAYGLVSWLDPVTNVSPTYMGEFYMNFGLAGVGVGMFLLGVLAVLVDRYLVVDRWTWTMPIMVSFIRWQESFIGHTIMPFIKTAAITLVAILLIKWLIRPMHWLKPQHQ